MTTAEDQRTTTLDTLIDLLTDVTDRIDAACAGTEFVEPPLDLHPTARGLREAQHRLQMEIDALIVAAQIVRTRAPLAELPPGTVDPRRLPSPRQLICMEERAADGQGPTRDYLDLLADLGIPAPDARPRHRDRPAERDIVSTYRAMAEHYAVDPESCDVRTWAEAIAATECDHCDAEADEECVTSGGVPVPVHRSHAVRLRVAAAALGWPTA